MSRTTPGNYVPLDVNYARDAAVRRAGPDAELLFVRGLAYAKGARSKGKIPDFDLEVVAVGLKRVKPSVAALIAHGLWVATDEGWLVRSWDRWNDDDDAASEAGTFAAHKRWHVGRNQPSDACEHCTGNATDDATADAFASESHMQGKGREGKQPSSDDTSLREDVESLCLQLADRIEGNGSNRPEITKTWRTECRRMIDLDGRELGKASRLIDWCQTDPFWRANILSMKKFRAQYDHLRLKALEDWQKRKEGGISPDGEVDPDVVLGADAWSLPDPPEGVEPGSTAYQTWARSERDSHKVERVAQARARLERVSVSA